MSLRDLTRKITGGDEGGETSPLVRAQELLGMGAQNEAWQVLASASQSAARATPRPAAPSPDASTSEAHAIDKALWDLAVRIDREDEAAPAFLRCIRRELRSDPGLAAFHWFELVDRLDEPPAIDLPLRLGLARAMLLDPDLEESAARMLEELDDDATRPAALRLGLAQAAVRARSASAETLTAGALSIPGLPEAERAALAEQLASARAAGLRKSLQEADAEGPIELAAMDVERSLQLFEAVPHAVDGAKLALELPGQGRRRIAIDKVQALAAVRIDPGNAAAYVLIDLLMDSLWSDVERLRTIRLRTRDFEPRALVPDAADSQLALQTLLRNLLAVSGAQPLPDASSAVGEPFHTFATERAYETQVLEITR
ncbi:MAG: hypothetical protein AAGC60_17980 [Acidobacteriota bacterium]